MTVYKRKQDFTAKAHWFSPGSVGVDETRARPWMRWNTQSLARCTIIRMIGHTATAWNHSRKHSQIIHSPSSVVHEKFEKFKKYSLGYPKKEHHNLSVGKVHLSDHWYFSIKHNWKFEKNALKIAIFVHNYTTKLRLSKPISTGCVHRLTMLYRGKLLVINNNNMNFAEFSHFYCVCTRKSNLDPKSLSGRYFTH
jgi:hypothetical protein